MTLKNRQPSLKYTLAVLAATLILFTGAEAASEYKILYDFSDTASDPSSALVADSAGNLYGTTRFSAGGGCGEGCGTVFKLTRQSGGYWAFKVIHSFKGPDGEQPITALIIDSSGNLYGTTQQGGANSVGTVFEVSPSGSTWKERVLYSFGGSGDLNSPSAALTLDSTGNLYGTASSGGSSGFGGVFKLKHSGSR